MFGAVDLIIVLLASKPASPKVEKDQEEKLVDNLALITIVKTSEKSVGFKS
jgi:hypothetical protein